jgi:hypothetical protein
MYLIQTLSAVLPTMKTPLIFGILNAAYIGIGIALALVFVVKKETSKRQTTTMFAYMVLGPILSIALILSVLILCVIHKMYVPYLQIEETAGSLLVTKSYSVSWGILLSIVATGFLIIPFSQAEFSKFVSIPISAKLRTPETELLTPNFVDAQKLENTYLSIISKQEDKSK